MTSLPLAVWQAALENHRTRHQQGTPMQTTRRAFLRRASAGTFGLLAFTAISPVFGDLAEDKLQAFKGRAVFDRILAKALAGKWQNLPMGECMKQIAMQLKGTPYVGFTLELDKDHEVCAVNLDGLDCVTFFEDTLDFARMLKLGGRTPQDLLKQVTFTRYRGGKLGDFTSRLHYTNDWMYDNQKKGVVKLLAPEMPGAEVFTNKVGIMSEHPNNYRQLKAHPEMIPAIKHFEDQINQRKTMYIPMNQLAAGQSMLKSGDIVGVTCNRPGIDIAHTGLVIQDEQGMPHFMDASSSRKNMRVTFEPGPISQAFNWSKSLTGAVFARPLEPTG
jgi:hypothetical protein